MIKALHKYWPIFVLSFLSLLITWPIFLPGYFSHHDDLQVMRIFEMRKCLEDLQIPCRWVPDMGFGNGFPLFNYYGVLPYYIGAFLSFFLGFINSAEILFFIPLVLAGISMFFLGKEIGGKWVGLTAATLYLYAPYRSLDAYVRGAVSESWALALIPFVFYFALNLSKTNSKTAFAALCLSWAGFLITHNIMVMLFTPFFILFLVYLNFSKDTKNFGQVIQAVILGVGLSAFFIFPAFLEKNLVQTDNLTNFDLDFRAHFVTINQLFLDRSFGYGASVLGPNDTISFQIGWPHWALVIVAFLLMINKRNILNFGLILVFLFSIFMTHNKSAFIWEQIGILRFTQFPWRFLSLSIFTSSLIGGLVILILKKELQKYGAILIIVSTIFLNFNYFKPESFYPLTDQQKLSGELWDEQRRASIKDYLPKEVYTPQEPAPIAPTILKGESEVKNYTVRSNYFEFNVEVRKTSTIEVPIFDFPKWQVFINNNKITHNADNLLRRIQFDLEPGIYKVLGKFKNTPIRTISNLITLISFMGLICLLYGKNKTKFI